MSGDWVDGASSRIWRNLWEVRRGTLNYGTGVHFHGPPQLPCAATSQRTQAEHPEIRQSPKYPKLLISLKSP